MRNPRGRPPHDDLLTPAEWRTVHVVRHGLTNQEIANRRGISLDGVKFHVANALTKLGLQNRIELKRWQGAPKNSVIRREGKNMQGELEFLNVGQIARSVKDIKQTEKWYRDVLSLLHLYTL
jgi:DNA-binding CsgD family transcriptional regulator